MAELHLKFLGGVGISQNGARVADVGGRKALALLCYLAINRQPFSRETLAGLLWGEMPDDSARMNLRHTLSRLRSFVGPHLNIKTREIAFNRNLPYWLDVEQFETAVASKDHNQLHKAIDLYRGDFLDGFYVKNASAFEEWSLARRVRLRDLAVQTLHTLVADCFQKAMFSEGIAYANRLLALDPWREEVHRQLMELLALSGQRSAALMQYDACRRVLSEELGVDPSQATISLYEQILRDQFGTTIPLVVTESAEVNEIVSTKPMIRHNLPPQATRFVGRESELSALNRFLTDTDVRLVTIVAAGGMGKSRLALETAQRHLENFTHGVWFASLAKLSSADEIVPTTAQALRFSFYEGGTPRQQLLDYLRNKSLLLVMDNYEHLLDGADLVADILQTAPQVKILATSREPLRLVEEQLFSLNGLAFSHEEISEDDEAVQFFMDRAYRLRPNLTLKAANMTHITTICQQVEGMPLGLELAAAWVDTLSLAEIAAELQESLDLLESDMRNVADRHRSVRAVFEASWDRLQPNEQQLFAQLSVFRGGFTRAAAQEVCTPDVSWPAFHRLLAALTRKSFLKHSMENGRYDIHELMRQFGAEKLAQSLDQQEAVKDRHSSYYCAFLQEQDAKLKGPLQKEAVTEIEVEHENARSAWEWAVERERTDWLDQALDGLGHFYEWQGLHQDVELNCRLASEKLMSPASGEGLHVLARILAWQGRFLSDEADRQLLKQSLAILKKPELGDYDTRADLAFALLRMGGVTVETETALELLNQSLALYRELGDQWHGAKVLQQLAMMGSITNGYAQVEKWGTESLEIRQKLGDQLGMATMLTLLARDAREQGQTEKAENFIRQSVSLLQGLGNQPQLASALFNMAIIKGFLGKFVECQSFVRESQEISSNLGSRSSVATANEHLGWAAIHLGNYTQAKEYLELARPVFLELNALGDLQLNFADLSMIALAEKRYIEALHLAQQCQNITPEFDHNRTYILGESLALMAYAERGLKNLDAARQYIIEVLKVTIQSNIFEPLLMTLPTVALLLVDSGELERAIEIYSLALTKPIVAKSQCYEDVAGQHIKAAAASLSPERVKAAQERGRARDFWETAKELLETDFADAGILGKSDK